jgi:hypothetical protein
MKSVAFTTTPPKSYNGVRLMREVRMGSSEGGDSHGYLYHASPLHAEGHRERKGES